MGCGFSRNNLETVDDSVHVMLKHDKQAAQKSGKPVTGYVPRASHPLLDKQNGESGGEEEAAATIADSGAPAVSPASWYANDVHTLFI